MAQLGTLSADGNTDEFLVRGNCGVWIHLEGSFGGGSVNMQFRSLDQSTWRTIAGTTRSAADDFKLDLPHGARIRGVLAGSSGPALIWEIFSVSHRN